MKYKVIFFENNTGSSDDYSGAFTFYTRAAAIQAATAWAEGAGRLAKMWDGSQWTSY